MTQTRYICQRDSVYFCVCTTTYLASRACNAIQEASSAPCIYKADIRSSETLHQYFKRLDLLIVDTLTSDLYPELFV